MIDDTTAWTLELTTAEWQELLTISVRKIDLSEWSMLEVIVDAQFLAWKASMHAQHGRDAVLLNGCALKPSGLKDILIDCDKTVELSYLDVNGKLGDLLLMKDAEIINFQGCEELEGAIKDLSEQPWASKVKVLGLPPRVMGKLEDMVRCKGLTKLLMRDCKDVEGAHDVMCDVVAPRTLRTV